ncbi:Ferritin heavy chain [Manis javanica]|nr:Ferritin heavy chain [Manis javanica]
MPSSRPRPPPRLQRCTALASLQPPARMAASPLQVLLNYHQISEAVVNCQVNLKHYAPYVYLSVFYYFDHNDVALKNFAKYFLQQSHEEREHAEKLMKLQNQPDGGTFLQDIKKPDCDDWENGLNTMECALHLEKSMNQSLLALHKLVDDKNDPHLSDFTEAHYLNEQVKSIKDLGDHAAYLYRLRCTLCIPPVFHVYNSRGKLPTIWNDKLRNRVLVIQWDKEFSDCFQRQWSDGKRRSTGRTWGLDCESHMP